MKDLNIYNKDNKVFIEIKDIIFNLDRKYSLSKISENSMPIKFFTATNLMRDAIGNILNIDGNFCRAKGFIWGYKELGGIKIIDKSINSIGQRIMISEHIDVNGHFELVATTKKILTIGNINFINIGWKDKDIIKYLRIDPYTGEHIVVKENKIGN